MLGINFICKPDVLLLEQFSILSHQFYIELALKYIFSIRHHSSIIMFGVIFTFVFCKCEKEWNF
jgi:hypothetical protein